MRDSPNKILTLWRETQGAGFYPILSTSKTINRSLSGPEFLRRFCQHILPYRFVKIRYYGILSSKQKQQKNPLLAKEKSESKQIESNQQRIVRLTGFDRFQCPFCKTGFMNTVELLPRIRSPTNVLYRTRRLSIWCFSFTCDLYKHGNRIVLPNSWQID